MMHIVFCAPNLTLIQNEDADTFYNLCKTELSSYLSDVIYLYSEFNINRFLAESNGSGVILVFFINKENIYSDKMMKLFEVCNNVNSIIWPIAMEQDSRMPPSLIQNYQSFDIISQIENRKLVSENIKTIACIFSRKIISQALPMLYNEKSLYFISHRRKDGEKIAGKLADKINFLSRYRKGYRDVVEVEVGMEAQNEIDRALKQSDALIFIQTPEAKNSEYIKKELYYALLHSIPILWLLIDSADKNDFRCIPVENPHLNYKSSDFDNDIELENIANKVEEQCFYLIMNCSGNVYNYIEDLKDVANKYYCKINSDHSSSLAYFLQYKKKKVDYYEDDTVNQYLQFFGRNPKEEDRINVISKIEQFASKPSSAVLLSSNMHQNKVNHILYEDNYEDYLLNLEEKLGYSRHEKKKKIIISGAFPDCDEIYKVSLSEALILYAKEILRAGYVLVFGAHPTFQDILFKIGEMYSPDCIKHLHMYISEEYIREYNIEELSSKATIKVTKTGKNKRDSLTILRNEMIGNSNAEAMICMGGKIKENKSEQGIDEEVDIAGKCKLPTFLIGSVGGRSSQYADELRLSNNWISINHADKLLNEALIYDLNHRKMVRRIIDFLENGSLVK